MYLFRFLRALVTLNLVSDGNGGGGAAAAPAATPPAAAGEGSPAGGTPATPAASGPSGAAPAASGAPAATHTGPAWLGPDGKLAPGWTKALGGNETWEQKYPTLEAQVKAHANLEKLLGAKANAVVVPGPNAKPEEIAEFRAKLGVPSKPEEYGLKPPEKLGDKPVPKGLVDPELLTEFQKTAHGLGLTKDQAAKLVEFDLARALKSNEVAQMQFAQAKDEAMKALQKEWGPVGSDSYKQQMAMAEAAAREAGFPGHDYPELANHPAFIKAMATIGAKFVEKPAAGARGTSNAPMNAKAELDAIMADKSHAYWSNKDAKAHAAAVAHVARLHAQLHG